jgi:hypothetical protein
MTEGILKDRNRKRLIRLGVIRLGYKETRQRADGSTYEFPVSDDHFLLHDAPDIEAFYAKQGIHEVRELMVRLPFPEARRIMPTSYGVWAGGILVCKGDGEYVSHATPFTCSVSQKTGRTSVRNAPGDTVVNDAIAQVPFDWGDSHFDPGDHVPCPGGAKDLYPHCAACKINSILKVLMAEPELLRLGYYQISTGSGRNYDTIRTTLELIPPHLLNKLVYYLRRVEGETMFVDETGQRKKRTNYFLELEPDPDMLKELLDMETARALSGSIHRLSLPETVPDPFDVDAADDGEYYDEDEPAPPPYAETQQPDEPTVVDGVVEPEAPTEPHKWTKAEANKLFAWTRNDLVITDDVVLAALNVAKISDYTGDYAAAGKAINDYLAKVAA